LAGTDVAEVHGEVDADADAGGVVEELDAGFGGAVGADEDEVDVDEVEDCCHCLGMLVGRLRRRGEGGATHAGCHVDVE